jgi:hypothetical protein
MRKACDIMAGKPEGKNHSEDLGVDGRKIGSVRTGCLCFRIGISGGLL